MAGDAAASDDEIFTSSGIAGETANGGRKISLTQARQYQDISSDRNDQTQSTEPQDTFQKSSQRTLPTSLESYSFLRRKS